MDLNRFKKSTQGIIELAMIIEQADSQNVEKIIKGVREADPDLCDRVMRKVVFFSELTYLDESILTELLAHTPPKTLAFALAYESQDFRQKVTRFLGLKENHALKEEEDKMGKSPSTMYTQGAQKQILRLARKLEGENRFVFELNECPRFQTELTRPVS